jgi:hypothetical protein
VLGRSVRHRGGCGLRQRSIRRRKNPLGANLDRDELHDGLQFAGGDLPDGLCRAWHGANQRRYCDQQCDFERVVPDQLLDPATYLPDDLRQNIAFAVIGAASNCRD